MPRVIASIVLGALAIGLPFAQHASASDTFFLDNSSKVASLEGVSNWTGPEQNGPVSFEGCQTGQFPPYDSTPYKFPPGSTGSLTMTNDLFSSCPSNVDSQSFNLVRGSEFGNGWWAPVDPLIGFASLTCAVTGQPNPAPLTASVDDQGSGLTCTVDDAAARASASFVSSAAPLRNGKAVALVQHLPGSAAGAGSAGGPHEITLRDRKRHVHGRSVVTLASGGPEKVRVRLSRALQKRVAKHDAVKVRAIINRTDGKPGTGDRATLVVMADGSRLPF